MISIQRWRTHGRESRTAPARKSACGSLWALGLNALSTRQNHDAFILSPAPGHAEGLTSRTSQTLWSALRVNNAGVNRNSLKRTRPSRISLDAAHMGTFYCLMPHEVVWNAKMQKAVSHSLCGVSEHEQAVSAAIEQLFSHALDMPPSTLQLARFAVAMQGLKEARDAFDALLGSSSDS
jgi:hypothetical protein